MKKLTASILLSVFVCLLISSCQKPNIHTTKDRPEDFSAYVD